MAGLVLLRWDEGLTIADGDRRAELTLQPTFRTAESEASMRWSLSKERVPDIVLTVRGAQQTEFVVFDAKYRVSGDNVLDAMQSAHVYQDSLRIGNQRASATLLIVPRTEHTAWLAESSFHRRHRVGIHGLSLSTEPTLPDVVVELFGALHAV